MKSAHVELLTQRLLRARFFAGFSTHLGELPELERCDAVWVTTGATVDVIKDVIALKSRGRPAARTSPRAPVAAARA